MTIARRDHTNFNGEALREHYADDPIVLALIDYIEQLLVVLPAEDVDYSELVKKYFGTSSANWWGDSTTTTRPILTTTTNITTSSEKP